MLGAKRHWFAGLSRLLGGSFAAAGVTPNHVTWASLFIAALGAAAISMGHLIMGAIVVFVAAGLDFLDGAIARQSGQITLTGGYLDSMLDRFVDFFFLLGVMWYADSQLTWVLGTAALFGTVATSFAKARVFQDRRPDASVWGKDVMERTERFLLLLPGVFTQGILDHNGVDVQLVPWLLGILAVGSILTVAQRMRTGMRVLQD